MTPREAAARALACLDLTNLDADCDAAAIEALLARTRTPHGPVAAVCVWPAFVAQARRGLAGSGIRVATVVSFPAGTAPLSATLGWLSVGKVPILVLFVIFLATFGLAGYLIQNLAGRAPNGDRQQIPRQAPGVGAHSDHPEVVTS